jgi:hypothetical protein
VENDYEYLIEEVSCKCGTYQEAMEIIQNYEDENSYPRVDFLEVKSPKQKNESFAELLMPAD